MVGNDKHSILVISAHAADFVWRAGGLMAKYADQGSRVHIACLTSGERGESAQMWKEKGATEESVREARKLESKAAADALGATIEFLDFGDHPLSFDRERIMRLTQVIRGVEPRAILTHHNKDVMNPDHEAAFELTRWVVRASTVNGVLPETTPLSVIPQIYSFESDQSSLDEFHPNVYIDISDVIDTKMKAMQAVATQYAAMGQRYMDRAAYRASMIENLPDVKYAEAFYQHMPFEGYWLPL